MNKSEKFWDRQADGYDPQDQSGDEEFIKALDKTKSHLRSDDIVLDFACGGGTSTCELAGYVKEIYGIDTSSRMIAVAIQRAEHLNIENAHFSQATLFDERCEKGSFDVILAFYILHLLENAQEDIDRINELLKPGGLFISATACLSEHRSFVSLSMKLVSKIGLVPYLNPLKITELEDSIVEGGFEIMETEALIQSPSQYYVVAKKIENLK